MILRRSMVMAVVLAALPVSSALSRKPEAARFDLNRISGSWFVTSFSMGRVTAISIDDAREMVGQRAYFDRDKAAFGASNCNAPSYRGFWVEGVIDIQIDCPDGKIVPNLLLSQDQVSASLDGVTYGLGREPRR